MEVWKNPTTVATWIGISLVIVLFLALSTTLIIRSYVKKMIRNKEAENQLKLLHQEELLVHSLKSQERERSRIAADLHDELIGELNRLVYYVYQEPPQEEMSSKIQDCISTARRISHDLSPPLIEEMSLSDILQRSLVPLQYKYKVVLKLDQRESKEMHADFKIQTMRVLQEILTNMDKHAQAKTISLHLRQTESGIFLKVSDDGIGYDTQSKPAGMGMKNIEMRINYLQGKYKLKSSPAGTSLLLYLP